MSSSRQFIIRERSCERMHTGLEGSPLGDLAEVVEDGGDRSFMPPRVNSRSDRAGAPSTSGNTVFPCIIGGVVRRHVRQRWGIIALILTLSFCRSVHSESPPANGIESRLVAEVTPTRGEEDGRGKLNKKSFSNESVDARLREMAEYLSHDRLQGRGVNTSGLDLAADYIAGQFKKLKLDTDHYRTGPFQEFQLLSLGREGAVQQLTLIDSEGEPSQLTMGTHYTSIMAARTGRIKLPVVFAGFGITAPSVSYDDYEDLTVNGAAVVILRHCPAVIRKEGDRLARHSWIRTKIRNAVEHGARAVLLCNDLSELDRIRNELKLDPEKSEPLLRAELTPETPADGVPTIHCRRSVLKPSLLEAGLELDAVEKRINSTSKPQSRRLEKMRLSAIVSRARTGRKLKNVLALLAGKSELASETIVLGAHYDHLGRGGWGSLALGANDEIHNGADDNASGTAVMIEVARQLAARKAPLKRSVLFIAFSGEELGLIGSKRYVRDPLIPMSQTIAMLNLDMVGRLRKEQLTVYGTGTSPAWPRLLNAKAKPLGLQIASRPGGFGPSDHASFYEKGVPVLHFFTGFHPQYHRPADDVELLNIEGMRQIASLVSSMIVEIAESDARPVRSQPKEGLVDLSPETLNGVLTGQVNGQRRVVLGVVPRESKREKGLVIESTVPRSPADRFGLRVGDVIVRIGDKEVSTTTQLTEQVQTHERGETVVLQIRRNGILLEVNVRL